MNNIHKLIIFPILGSCDWLVGNGAACSCFSSNFEKQSIMNPYDQKLQQQVTNPYDPNACTEEKMTQHKICTAASKLYVCMKNSD